MTVTFEKKPVKQFSWYEGIPIKHLKLVSEQPYGLISEKEKKFKHSTFTTLLSWWFPSYQAFGTCHSSQQSSFYHWFRDISTTLNHYNHTLNLCCTIRKTTFFSKVLCTNTVGNSRKQRHLVASYYKTESNANFSTVLTNKSATSSTRILGRWIWKFKNSHFLP